MINDHEKNRLLIHEWQGKIYDFALRRLKNEADAADVTQEALLALLRDRHQLRTAESLRAWIYKLTLNAVMNHRRGRRRERSRLEHVAKEHHAEGAGDLVMRRQHGYYLKEKVESLAEDLREVLVLRYFHSLTQSEISDLLELPRGTVRSRLDRGLNQLRESMAGAGAPVFGLGLEQSLGLLNPDPLPLHVASSLQSTLIPITGKGALILGGITVKLKLLAGALIVLCIGVLGDRAWSQAVAPEPSAETLALREKLDFLKQSYRELDEKRQNQRGREGELRKQVLDLSASLDRAKAQVASLEKSVEAGSGKDLVAKKLVVKGPESVESESAGGPQSISSTGLEKIIDELVTLGDPFQMTDAEKDVAAGKIEKLEKKISLYKKEPVAMASALLRILRSSKDRNRRSYAALLLGSIRRILRQKPFSGDLHKATLELIRDAEQDIEVRVLALQSLQPGGDRKALSRLLIDLIDENEAKFARAALIQLASVATKEARQRVLRVLSDENEDLNLRRDILENLNLKDFPLGVDELVKSLKSVHEPLLDIAIEKAQNCPRRKEVREQLEELLRTEKDENRLFLILLSLRVQGGRSSLLFVDQIRDDENRKLELRSVAEQAAVSIRQRLEKK